jgi:hypothetical protein
MYNYPVCFCKTQKAYIKAITTIHTSSLFFFLCSKHAPTSLKCLKTSS